MSELAVKGGTPARTKPWPKWPIWQDSTLAEIKSVLEGGRWAISSYFDPAVALKERQFAAAFSKFLGCKYCIPIASGTAALETTMEALGIGAGDEVITPSCTWVADAVSILNINAAPVFVDIDPLTLCLSPEAVEAAITPRTRAVIAVHLYGCLADLDKLVAICNKHHIHLIEDCSHVHGSAWRGQRTGTFGAAGCFSTQHTKLLAAGEGGCVTTNSLEVKQGVEQLKCNSRVYTDTPKVGGLEVEPLGTLCGGNYNLSEFQSAILLDALPRLEAQNKLREENAKFLDDELSSIEGFIPMTLPAQVTARALYYYVVRCDPKYWAGVDTEKVRAALAAEIGMCERVYVPIHKSPLYKPLTKKRFKYSDAQVAAIQRGLDSNLPHSDAAYAQCVSLFHPILMAGREDMQDVVNAFAKVSRLKKEIG